tara:strand:- start:614 stop:1387 length:774 start_codon:yes stop_codon:yes gene_type:complete
MEISFVKYQGTGNDFIMIDAREKTVNFSVDTIVKTCHRRFGIGADGLILINNHSACDFEMDYYNADGSQSFCGNGSRCAQAFAKQLGIIDKESIFLAIDGMHMGKSVGAEFATKMGDVNQIQKIGDDYFIHTGSPHFIKYVADINSIDVEKEGAAIRNSPAYKKEGTNVNFVSVAEDCLMVRTYERGVEAETYSCGTGVTAVAISYLHQINSSQNQVKISTKGGDLLILLKRESDTNFKNIWLQGPAQEVYKGVINI